MSLVATIHTSDVDEMAELLAVCRSHGDVTVAYVDGGIEVHRNGVSWPDKGPTLAKPKAAPKQSAPVDPCPHCGREFKAPQGRQRHIDGCGARGTSVDMAQRARERVAEAL